MVNQKIFKRSFVSDLRDAVKSGETLCDYLKKEISYPAASELESTIKVDPEKLQLKYKGEGESASNDLDNAIAIYEAYPDLTEVQASDPRLWTYLTHVTLREYVLARWPMVGSCEQIIQDEEKTSAINFVLSHWFSSGNDRKLRRNAVARLWWAVRLTRAPWEQDPEYFKDLAGGDPYRFTRVLLSTQDIYQQVLERALGRDSRLFISVLEFLEEGGKMKREQIRDFMKELNLALSVKNFSILPRPKLKESVFNIGTMAVAGQE